MWNEVEQLLYDGVENNLFAGCALCIRNVDEEIYVAARGMEQRRPEQIRATTETIWDIASITKVLCTAHVYLQAASQKEILPETALQYYFPEAPPDIKIEHILSHSAGFPAWRPFYSAYLKSISEWKTGIHKTDIFRRAIATNIEAMPLAQHTYSDVGFIILAALLERHYAAPLDTIWANELPVEATHGLLWGSTLAAATEDCPIRKRVVVGEVHDLNAASMGGVSGHAGLFGDVRSVAAAANWPLRSFHGQITDLNKETISHFWRYRGAGSHCLGWDTPSAMGSSASEMWPSFAVGHLGFTGCSVWIAIEEGITVTFLSNRVHPIIEGGAVPYAPPHPRYVAFKQFRPELHRRIWTALRKQGILR